MGGLFWFVLFCLVLYFVFKRILIYVLNLICTHKLRLSVRLGQVSLLPPSVQDSHFALKNFAVHVDKVRLTSSLVNAEVKRLLGLVIEDVRITKDFNSSTRSSQVAHAPKAEGGRTDILEKLLPPLMSFVQFMCVSINNVTFVAQLDNNVLVHATINNITLDGSILPRSQIAVCGSIENFSSRLLQTFVSTERSTRPELSEGTSPCLAELSVSIQVEIHINTANPAVEKLSFNVNNPLISINDRLLGVVKQQNTTPEVKAVEHRDSNGSKIWSTLKPRKCDVNITGTELKLFKGDQSAFVNTFLSLFRFSLEKAEDEDASGEMDEDKRTKARVHVQSLYSEIQCGRWFSMAEAEAMIHLTDDYIDAMVTISRLSILYTHAELSTWLHLIPASEKRQKAPGTKLSSRTVPLKLNVEAWDLSAVAVFQESLPLRGGMTHFRVEILDDPEVSTSAEYQAETLWCCLGNRTPSDPGQKRVHFWNSPLYVGLIIGKVERLSEADVTSLKNQILLDVIRFEWSPTLMQSLTAIHSGMSLLRKPKSVPEPVDCPPVRRSFSITAAGINVFLLMKKEAALAMRIDSLAADKQPEKMLMSAEGIKGLFIIPGAPFSCAKSQDIKRGNLDLKRIQILLRTASVKPRSVEVENLDLNWDTRLHMTVLQVLDEWKSFRSSFRSTKADADPQSGAKSTPNTWNVYLKGQSTICAALSSRHSVELRAADPVKAVICGVQFELAVPKCAFLFDGNSILEAEGLVWTLADQSTEQIAQERATLDDFEASNRCGLVNVAELRLCFPYRYSFAEACQQELVSVFKWLKLLHKKRPSVPMGPGAPSDERLYRDVHITVARFSLQLCDDPFEVKLRDNYELREDEYRESVKRKRMLDTKIEELRKTHPLLTQGKIDELYANLACKNAEIYVQRAQRMYETRPMRTALFRWEMDTVDIIALADPCFHGYDNIVRNIQDMDPDSPWPDEGISFTTLWCRHVRATCRQWRFLLRDFPQPLLDIQELLLFGRLAGAEQQSSWRAKRTCIVPVAQPWSDVQIERGMSALKFYHDFSCDADSLRFAYGPCWEPVIAQCNLASDFVIAPSKDPSPPLPFWDKLRLILHGRLTMSTQQLTLLLHTSLDPYSTTEEMEVTWTDLAMDWTNANFIFKGDFHVYVRTASKYDDCRLLHIPRLKMTARLSWLCLADPNDHHTVTPCAPDRVPEYSINQEHDSYRAFRSQNLTVALSMETKPGAGNAAEVQALLYGSTLRWFENLKFILSGVSRPIRRGVLFNSTKPRKPQLSRHYKSVRLALSLHRFHICYWMSVSMQRGFELNCGRLTLSSEHALRLVPVDDGLKHRPKSDWSIVFLNCELQDAEIWLQSALGPDSEDNAELNVSIRQPVEKFYFLSVQRVSYGREAALTPSFGTHGTSSNVPTHRLVVQDLRGAWTKSNRLVAFALYDSWVKAQLLKRNLSTDVMKLVRMPEGGASPMKPRNASRQGSSAAAASADAATSTAKRESIATPVAESMLQQLLADVHHQNVVFSEDLSSGATASNRQSAGMSADQEGVHLNWLIELVNSQVLLKGCETKGYIIISAGQAKILQRLHPPVWRDRSLVSKTSWVCSLDGMQYFATISAGEQDALDENILWLSTDHIGSREGHPVASIPDMVGSGQSVGGVISETVGGCDSSVQLQRIVSRCKCELVFVSYGDNTLDLEHDLEHGLIELPLPPSDDVMDLWAQREEPVDAFTLTHHDLNICTNSLQYEMLLDVINNLLLYVEPHRKEASERLQRLRFQLQLSSTQDQRRPVQQLQNQLRSLISQLRRLEKDTFLLQRALGEDPNNSALVAEIDGLERKIYECKEKLNAANEELALMVSCLKEAQLSAHQRLQAARQGNGHVTTLRRSEINFKHAQWRLTEADGQLGIADVVLSNFLYNKLSRSDDSCEHSLEIGYVSVTNLLPNQVYKQVIVPTELNRNMPVDRQVAVRMFSRDKAPVGGICIKEIFEINVVPFTFAMTYQFFKTMMRFCFPEKDPETLEDGDHSETGSSASLTRKGAKHFATGKSKNRTSKESSFYVPIEDKDDVEKMKERAEKNKLFIYIKIPEVPVKVSYKGGREKNIEDVHEFSLVVPTLEYHNVTWTWLDLFLAMKNDSKRVLLSQAIKQKLQIRPRSTVEEGGTPQEEDKARLLLGGLSMPGDARSSKRGFFKSSK